MFWVWLKLIQKLLLTYSMLTVVNHNFHNRVSSETSSSLLSDFFIISSLILSNKNLFPFSCKKAIFANIHSFAEIHKFLLLVQKTSNYSNYSVYSNIQYPIRHHSRNPIVCAPPPLPFLLEEGGRTPYQIPKREGGGLDRTSIFRGGLLGKRGSDLFQGGLQFLDKKKTRIFNDKKSL